MNEANNMILLVGLFGVTSIVLGYFWQITRAPLLLAFLFVGMLAGVDGPLHIEFSNFEGAYLAGTFSLVIILFSGGLSTPLSSFKLSLWPAFSLSTVGIFVTAAVTALAGVLIFNMPWLDAAIIGTAMAPTDAAAVGLLLRHSGLVLPARVDATLGVESGMNDPVSVTSMLMLVNIAQDPHSFSALAGIVLILKGIVGGALIGFVGGRTTIWLLKRLPISVEVAPVLALAMALAFFGLAQILQASGFMAIYLMSVMVGAADFRARHGLTYFFDSICWLAQIMLFLLLGLLITPHTLIPFLYPIIVLTLVLVLAARPLAAVICVKPFGYSWQETIFIGWVGLRGAVPIYLSIIPVLSGMHKSDILFGITFGLVITSLIIQGWSAGLVGSWLGFRKVGNRNSTQATSGGRAS